MEADLPLADELAAVFSRLAGLLLTEETVTSALGLITEAAQAAVPGAIGSGVSMVDSMGRRTTKASSDPRVEGADSLQYELGEGPCLASWGQGTVVRVDNVAADQRWPKWSQAVAGLQVRSSLSAPLVYGDISLGVIKVYSDQEAAFNERSEHLLGLFAGQAAIFLAHVQAQESAQALSDELLDALASRDVIGTARGIIVARRRITEDEALSVLLGISRRTDRTLRDVAKDLVASTINGKS